MTPLTDVGNRKNEKRNWSRWENRSEGEIVWMARRCVLLMA
jgi:hypothetical protein